MRFVQFLFFKHALGQALKSDTYGDFRLGQLTQANIVAVSG